MIEKIVQLRNELVDRKINLSLMKKRHQELKDFRNEAICTTQIADTEMFLNRIEEILLMDENINLNDLTNTINNN